MQKKVVTGKQTQDMIHDHVLSNPWASPGNLMIVSQLNMAHHACTLGVGALKHVEEKRQSSWSLIAALPNIV